MNQSYPPWMEDNDGKKGSLPSEERIVKLGNPENCGETLGPLVAWQENMRAEIAHIFNKSNIGIFGKIGRFFSSIANGNVVHKLEEIILGARDPTDLTQRILQFAPALPQEECCALIEAMYQQGVFIDTVARDVVPKLQKEVTLWRKLCCRLTGALCLALWAAIPFVGTPVMAVPLAKTAGKSVQLGNQEDLGRVVAKARLGQMAHEAFLEWCRGTEGEGEGEGSVAA